MYISNNSGDYLLFCTLTDRRTTELVAPYEEVREQTYLVALVDVLFDKGGVEDLTVGCADDDQLAHVWCAAAQAVVTLQETTDGQTDRCWISLQTVHREVTGP